MLLSYNIKLFNYSNDIEMINGISVINYMYTQGSFYTRDMFQRLQYIRKYSLHTNIGDSVSIFRWNFHPNIFHKKMCYVENFQDVKSSKNIINFHLMTMIVY